MNTTENHINALILIGGKSTRMGTDKSNLSYFDKPQQEHVYDLLKVLIPEENIYYSVRKNQVLKNKSVITDVYPNLGPFGAILSAFEYKNNSSWLVLAIDLPYLNINKLKFLIKNRNISKFATTFQGNGKKYPEPLMTIWEPKSFPLLKENYKQGNYSLISILKNNAIKTINIDDKLIQNINTKEDYNQIKKHFN